MELGAEKRALLRNRYGVIGIGVAVLAFVAGMAVAGRPSAVADDIVISDIRQAETTSSTSPGTTPGMEPVPTDASTSPSTPSTPGTESTPVPSSVVLPGLSGPDSTAGSTTTQPPAPTTTTLANIRVLVANGGGANGLASSMTVELQGYGYANAAPTNTLGRRGRSTIYYAPGFEAAATELGALIAIEDLQLQPAEPVTQSAEPADLWVVLGGDRIN